MSCPFINLLLLMTFFADNFPHFTENFEHAYLKVRCQEGRVLTDEQVQQLPLATFLRFPLADEWQLRRLTAERFATYCQQKKFEGAILDLGCGNGWFTAYIATQLPRATHIFGMEVNKQELDQAARVWQHDNRLLWIYGDIFDHSSLPSNLQFSLITLNAVVQYFPNVSQLLQRLCELLTPQGEIHLLDSPWYKTPQEQLAALERSRQYYIQQGVPEMANYYHPHLLSELQPFSPDCLYSPSLWKKIARQRQSPFTWWRIKKT